MSLKSFDPRPLWQRAKWTFAIASLVVLFILGVANRLTGGSSETDRDLVLAIGALISVYLGAEGWQDMKIKSALASRMPNHVASSKASIINNDVEDDGA